MMTPDQRAQWLLDRKTAVGGSEIGALLSHIIPEVKYGCRRNLWYEKSNWPVDFEKFESAPMQLGNLMEGPACDLYAELTGNKIEEKDRMIHPYLPEASVNIDRLVHFSDDGAKGVIETKNTGNRVFYAIKRHGDLPTEYSLQVNHGMMIAGAVIGEDIKRGVMVVGKSDDPRFIARTIRWHLKQPLDTEINPSFLLYWEVQKNEQVCEAIMREIPIFWKSLNDKTQIPDRLEDENDPRCGRCQFRVTCRSAAYESPSDKDDIPIADELMPLVQEYIERREESDRAEELTAETKEVIATILGERSAVNVHVGDRLRPIYYRQQDGKPLYAEAIKNMSTQYNQLRETLVQIQRAVTDPNARDVDGTVQRLVTGAELIPPPSSFLRKGKPSRPLMLQYLSPKTKEE